MKKIIFLAIVLFTLISADVTKAENEECISTTLTQTEQTPEYVDEPTQPHRTGTPPIVCIISTEDLIIIGTDTSDITLYEIYDEDGFCLASASNKADFLACIFTIRGTLQIKFHSEHYILSGWIIL